MTNLHKKIFTSNGTGPWLRGDKVPVDGTTLVYDTTTQKLKGTAPTTAQVQALIDAAVGDINSALDEINGEVI